jgi:tRNA (guanine37-N1)-methyltransferase
MMHDDVTARRVRFDIFSIFPDVFAGPFDVSILRRAQARGLIEIAVHDIRQWATDRHRTTDDTPYGGGPGMVMSGPPILAAVEDVLGSNRTGTRSLILSASGVLFTQAMAWDFAGASRIALICGHYEGIDDRVRQLLDAQEVAVGDYVLTGGELPAMVIVDAVTRLIPGVISAASTGADSHGDGLLEYPQFTRPERLRGLPVPPVLLTGHHAEIAKWRPG